MKFVRSSVFYDAHLLLALALGGFAVAGLRLPWGRAAGGSWLWGLLVASAFLGGFALKQFERTIPGMQPPLRPAEPRGRNQRRDGAICILLATLLVALIVVFGRTTGSGQARSFLGSWRSL